MVETRIWDLETYILKIILAKKVGIIRSLGNVNIEYLKILKYISTNVIVYYISR